MKILLTGGNGFIARNLFEGLERAHKVTSLSRQKLDLLDAAKVFDYLKFGKFDVVIHAATYDAAPRHSKKDPSKVLENNLRMFFNLARGGDYFDKMLYFGSGAEFARPHWAPKMKEDYFDRHVPLDQYGLSKYIMNKYARLSENIYNLRLFGVFGKYEDWRVRFISSACAQALFGLPIVVKQNVRFDYLHIDDLVNLTKWFIAHSPREKDYNLCTARSFSHLGLARKILKLAGKELDIVIKDKHSRVEYSGDNTRLLREVGRYEFKDMEGGLRELYGWYSANKKKINLLELKRSVL